MSSTWKNFKNYTKYGAVPTVKNNKGNLVPQNSFYKSVDHVSSVALPLMRCIGTVIFQTALTLSYISLNLLYTAFAYLSYLPAKGLAKIVDDKDLKDNTESLVNYSRGLQVKALEHSLEVSGCVTMALNYALCAVVWATALAITPIVWAVDKVASKFSEVEKPAQVSGAGAGVQQ